MSVGSGLTPAELEAIDARQRELEDVLSTEEHERRRQWEASRKEGSGVTPGRTVTVGNYGDLSYLDDADVNPKQAMATRDQKPPLHLLEHAAEVEIARALEHGATKYGRKNFHVTPILANVYGGAIRRHVGQWLEGEDYDLDSGLSHLAHIGANIHVLLAAMAHGSFVDDRGPEEQSDVQKRLSDASNRSRP